MYKSAPFSKMGNCQAPQSPPGSSTPLPPPELSLVSSKSSSSFSDSCSHEASPSEKSASDTKSPELTSFQAISPRSPVQPANSNVQKNPSTPADYEAIETNEICMMYLFSSPFKATSFVDSKTEIRQLQETLKNVAGKAKISILFEALVATSHNRLKALRNHPNILYIASQGDSDGSTLFMEDSAGNCQPWTRERIQEYFENAEGMAKGQHPIQCAIIGAPCSEELAKLFMEHGNIRHVVTVKQSEKAVLAEMYVFIRIFLSNILKSRPVNKSFKAAMIELEDDYQFSTKKYVLYQREGYSGEKLFGERTLAHPNSGVRDFTPRYQFEENEVPAHYINQDVDALRDLYKFFVEYSRALGVLLAPKGCGSTTTAIRLAYHLAPRRVFQAIYFISLEAYLRNKNVTQCSEGDIVKCVVESLCNDMDGLDSCTTFEDLISAVTQHFHQNQQNDADPTSDRILFIFDGCCLGEQVMIDDQQQLRTTVIANLIAHFLRLAERVSVLAVCHKEVTFPLTEGHVVQRTILLKAMSDLDVARLILKGSVRPIHYNEILTPEEEDSIAALPEYEKLERAAMIFSKSPIVKELEGLPAAVLLFYNKITHETSLLNIEHYIGLARKSVAKSKNIIRPYLVSVSRGKQKQKRKTEPHQLSPENSPRSKSADGYESRYNVDDKDNEHNRLRSSSDKISQAALKSAGCESALEASTSSNDENCDFDCTSTTDFVESDKTVPDEKSPTMDGCDRIWNDFQAEFHRLCHTRKLSNLERKAFFELATTVQEGQSSVDCDRLTRITIAVHRLIGLLPVLFDDPTPLVHFLTRAGTVDILTPGQSNVQHGTCLIRVDEEGSNQLILSWVVLEGGDTILINKTVAVEEGPEGARFRCDDIVYETLRMLIQDKAVNAVWFLYPNIRIDSLKI